MGKFLARLIERNSDDLVRGTSQFWDNFLVRIANVNILRFLVKELENGKVVLEGWVVPSVFFALLFIVLVIVSLPKLDSRRK